MSQTHTVSLILSENTFPLFLYFWISFLKYTGVSFFVKLFNTAKSKPQNFLYFEMQGFEEYNILDCLVWILQFESLDS